VGGLTTVAGWGPGGLYFTVRPPAAGKGYLDTLDVWVVDPAHPAGAHRVGPNPAPSSQLVAGESPLFSFHAPLGGGAAWDTDYSRPPKVVIFQVGGGEVTSDPDRVERMDLRTGTLSAWYVGPPGTTVQIAGLDAAGHPVLTVQPATGSSPNSTGSAAQGPRLLLLTGPDQTVDMSAGSPPPVESQAVFADAHGIWMATARSLWLYRHGGLQKVADLPARLFGQATVSTVAGACA
jgi:hypothetical protein